ncbi:MAG: hypothetical protein WC496_10255 [Phycisphaerae bacterium]|jgi:hypothetical protein
MTNVSKQSVYSFLALSLPNGSNSPIFRIAIIIAIIIGAAP